MGNNAPPAGGVVAALEYVTKASSELVAGTIALIFVMPYPASDVCRTVGGGSNTIPVVCPFAFEGQALMGTVIERSVSTGGLAEAPMMCLPSVVDAIWSVAAAAVVASG